MVSTATIVGRSHRIRQQNGQDFAAGGSPRPEHAYGVVCDGCGSKYRQASGSSPSHNEVGAKLLGSFAANFLEDRLDTGTVWSPASIAVLLEELHAASLDFLGGWLAMMALRSRSHRQLYAATHMLATVVGFVRWPNGAAFFWAGDGCLLQGDEVVTIDAGNRPDYLAYHLEDLGGPGRPAGSGFETVLVADSSKLSRLAVATDGWRPDMLREVISAPNSLALQRWLNVQARERGVFEDDGAIALWQRPLAAEVTAAPNHTGQITKEGDK